MKNFYLIASLLGAVLPYMFFFEFFMAEGVDIVKFLQAVFANGAAGGFAADILMSSAVFWSYLIVSREPGWWKYVVLNLAIGLSCALPYYLYVKAKEREVAPALA